MRDRDVPLGPLAVLFGYPFWIFGKSVTEEADQAVGERELEERARKGAEVEQAAERKRTQQERLARENARMREALRRETTDSALASPPTTSASPDASTQRSSSSPSVDGVAASSPGASGRELQRELAALQRSLARRREGPPLGSDGVGSETPRDSRVASLEPTRPTTAARPTGGERSAGPLPGPGVRTPRTDTPDGVQTDDRDRDGRPDRWIYAEPDGGSRELLDENADGRADLVRHFDAARVLLRVEEDLDFDGRFEISTQYRDGERVRRLEDTDADGMPDRWSYFQNGEVARLESDRDGDGFRDSVSLYSRGELEEQQEDRNGDGQPDRLERFRNGETTEVHEDLDGDGRLDVASYYEAGKLVRRELRSAEVLQRWGGSAPTPVSERSEAEADRESGSR